MLRRSCVWALVAGGLVGPAFADVQRAPKEHVAAKGPVPSAGQAKARRPLSVLFFTKSSWFIHSVITPKGDEKSHAHGVLDELAARHNFVVTHTKDGGVFTKDGLKAFDVIVFYANGDLTQPGADGQPPMPSDGKQNLITFVEQGKGLVGIHAASDAFHSPGDRWKNNVGDVDPFIALLGGEFIAHGAQGKARVFCPNRRFPGFANCNGVIELYEEYYGLKNLAPDLHVLQWLATFDLKNTGGNDAVYRRGPYPITWARLAGKGRVFHTALGHREDVWTAAWFQEMIVGAIRWAGRAVEGPPVKPNVAQVTPFYRDEPVQDVKSK